MFSELRYQGGMVWALHGLGEIALAQDKSRQAWTLLKRCLVLSQHTGSKSFTLDSLVSQADLICALGEAEHAAQLLGAVDDPLHKLYAFSTVPNSIFKGRYERSMAAVRARLDPAAFSTAFAEGQRMSLDEAVVWVLEDWRLPDTD